MIEPLITLWNEIYLCLWCIAASPPLALIHYRRTGQRLRLCILWQCHAGLCHPDNYEWRVAGSEWASLSSSHSSEWASVRHWQWVTLCLENRAELLSSRYHLYTLVEFLLRGLDSSFKRAPPYPCHTTETCFLKIFLKHISSFSCVFRSLNGCGLSISQTLNDGTCLEYW